MIAIVTAASLSCNYFVSNDGDFRLGVPKSSKIPIKPTLFLTLHLVFCGWASRYMRLKNAGTIGSR